MFHGIYGQGWGWITLVLFIVVIWIIMGMINQKNRSRVNEKTPLDILKERYAKGEINKQEFEEKKKDLEMIP